MSNLGLPKTAASKRPKIGDLGQHNETPQGPHDEGHDWHHVYKTDEAPQALAMLDSMRIESIANQRDVLAKSKEAFGNEVQKILDAMSRPDDPGSIHAVIAGSDFNVHLDAALAAAESIIYLQCVK